MLLVLLWLGFAFSVRSHVVVPLQTLSNVLAALREGDYSLRARAARRDDSLGGLVLEANALGETLRNQRLGALEATALLRKVMEEIDVAVFAFDDQGRLQLINRAGERLLASPAERVLGSTAAELGLADCLEARAPSILSLNFSGSPSRRHPLGGPPQHLSRRRQAQPPSGAFGHEPATAKRSC